jgi:hypothetical protein
VTSSASRLHSTLLPISDLHLEKIPVVTTSIALESPKPETVMFVPYLLKLHRAIVADRSGFKSKALKARQDGNPPEVIAYADKANERLRRKYYHMVLKNNKKTNVAKTAVARELACFMWGMITGNVA